MRSRVTDRKLSDVPILLERPSATQKWCPWAELVAHNVDVHDDVRDDIPRRREGICRVVPGPVRVNNTHSRTYAPRDRRCHDVVPMSPARPDEMAANRKSVYGTVDGSRVEYIVRTRMVPRRVNWKFTDVSTW